MVSEINSELFEQKVLNDPKPSIIKIYTEACPNCKTIHPIFEQTAESNINHYNFFEMNAHENLELVKRFKVLSVPTLLFFSHGILVNKKTGVISQKKIEKRLLPLTNYSKESAKSKEVTGFFKLPWK